MPLVSLSSDQMSDDGDSDVPSSASAAVPKNGTHSRGNVGHLGGLLSSSSSSYDDNLSDDSTPSMSSGESHHSEKEESAEANLENIAALQRKLKNQKKTAKARETVLMNKAKRKLAQQAQLKLPGHPAEEFRSLVQPESVLNQPGGTGTRRFQRLRLLISFLKRWAATLVTFFSGTDSTESDEGVPKPDISHTLITCVIDDTNMRLSSPSVPGANEIKKSRVVSVMNHVQQLILCYTKAAAGGNDCANNTTPGPVQHRYLTVHTPLVCLPKADTRTIAVEFVTRLLFFVGRVSRRFEPYGLTNALLQGVLLQGVCCCFDSLVTNIAMLKKVRVAIAAAHRDNSSCEAKAVYPFWGVTCQLHQLALARKPLLNSWGGFWSSIVRLGHLFEIHSFRAQFRSALLEIIQESFKWIPVAQLPEQSSQWAQRRCEVLGIQSPEDLGSGSGRTYQRKHFEYHRRLWQFDNSDCESLDICHWCTGCCVGTSAQQKSRHALLQICKYFLILFGFGYPIPLLYRWVHAQRALQYCKVTSPGHLAFFSV